MQIKWLNRALCDLEESLAYIAEDNPIAAKRVAKKVHAAITQLKTHPHMGRPGRVNSTRELIIFGTPYIIPYRITGTTIEILRVFHSARHFPDGV